jgi:anti-anti-sigma factor
MSNMAHGFTIERRDRSCVITLRTDLTAVLVAGLQAAVKDELSAGVLDLEFDFGQATMLDSSGIGLLIATANSATRAGGAVHLSHVSKDVKHLLQSMRLTSRLDVRGNE